MKFKYRNLKSEEAAQTFILKMFSNDIDFLINEYDRDLDCIKCDLFQTIHEEDFGFHSTFNVNYLRLCETIEEIINDARGE